jgi:RNA polymerase sigma factor (sigma-70 family)
LIFVSKAATIRDGARLGNWLYGVACRVAERARASTRRRHAREVAGAAEAGVAPEQTPEGERHELAAVLDEELSRLPDKYRAPLVLCNLQGETYEEAARRLKWPIGTVRSRMARARELMRLRLVRRGFAPVAGALTTALNPAATRAAMPSALAEATAAAARVAGARALNAGVVPASVLDLTRGVFRTMIFTKLRTAGVAALAIVSTTAGAGLLARQVVALAATAEQDDGKARSRARVAGGAVDRDRASTPTAEVPGRVEAELVEGVESLRPEVELLTIEVETLKSLIAAMSNEMLSKSTRATAQTVQSQIDQMHKKLAELREVYLARSKELGLKRRELEELQRRIETRRVERLPANPRETPTTPGISRALEERLSAMDQKLEQILSALKGREGERGR